MQIRAPQRIVLLVENDIARIEVDNARRGASLHHQKSIVRIRLGRILSENGLVHHDLQTVSRLVLPKKRDIMLVRTQPDVAVVGTDFQPTRVSADGKVHITAAIGKPAVVHPATGGKKRKRQKNHPQTHNAKIENLPGKFQKVRSDFQ